MNAIFFTLPTRRVLSATCSALAWIPALSYAGGDCSKTSTDLVPLSDFVTGTYQGFPGGLYADGANQVPADHLAAGIERSQKIVPLDAKGNPDSNGAVVLATVGMSNTNLESEEFIQLVAGTPLVHPAVRVVNLSQGGDDAKEMASSDDYWNLKLPLKLQQGEATPEQVQVVWLKSAVAHPSSAFPAHAKELQAYLEIIVQKLHDNFENLQLVFISSRTYGNYATTDLNPEPYAYESGFAVKWLIEDQIAGKSSLNFDPSKGAVVAPWIGWGPYLWADGTTPRSDGLFWDCTDFADDGTHPSPDGEAKVAARLLDFLMSAPMTTSWFRSDDQTSCGVTGAVNLYEQGVGGATGVPRIGTTARPSIETTYQVQAQGAAPQSPGAFFIGPKPVSAGQVALDSGWLLTNVSFVWPLETDSEGVARLPEFPPDPKAEMCGLSLYVQYVVVDPTVDDGSLAMTSGLEIVIGL